MGFSCHQNPSKKYQISINKFSRFSFIQLNLSRIAFDNQKLQQTIEKILRYFCMGFSCHQNPSKKYQISINKFSRFSFIQLNLSRIAFDNQKLQQTIEKILRYFCMGFSCHQNPSKKYQISINKFSRFSFIQLNLSRIAFDNQKLQQTIEKILR